MIFIRGQSFRKPEKDSALVKLTFHLTRNKTVLQLVLDLFSLEVWNIWSPELRQLYVGHAAIFLAPNLSYFALLSPIYQPPFLRKSGFTRSLLEGKWRKKRKLITISISVWRKNCCPLGSDALSIMGQSNSAVGQSKELSPARLNFTCNFLTVLLENIHLNYFATKSCSAVSVTQQSFAILQTPP